MEEFQWVYHLPGVAFCTICYLQGYLTSRVWCERLAIAWFKGAYCIWDGIATHDFDHCSDKELRQKFGDGQVIMKEMGADLEIVSCSSNCCSG